MNTSTDQKPTATSDSSTTTPETPLLEITDLSMDFHLSKGFFGSKGKMTVRAVRGVNLSIAEGETVGLVGESGSGKTTLGRCILGAHRPSAGQIWYRTTSGERVDLAALRPAELREYRQEIRMIFQDPNSSLNPRLTVGQIIAEPLIANKLARPAEIKERVTEMMRLVGLRPDHAERYPHAFSGGERQRIGIARALITRPRLVVCDEAVTALDVSIRSQVLNLLQDLQAEMGLTYLFVSHDLTVIRHLCDRVAVMYVGELVEESTTAELFRHPGHPYTETLLRSLPRADPRLRDRDRGTIKGEVPDPADDVPGCLFHPRCPYAEDRCATEVPAAVEVRDGVTARCHFADTLALEGMYRTPRT